jgi:hypothetical protein
MSLDGGHDFSCNGPVALSPWVYQASDSYTNQTPVRTRASVRASVGICQSAQDVVVGPDLRVQTMFFKLLVSLCCGAVWSEGVDHERLPI